MIRAHRWATLAAALALSSGCGSADHPLGTDSEYAALIGAEFVVVGKVAAFGVFAPDGTQVSYATLIPNITIAGPEIAFNAPVPKDTRFKVLSAWREGRMFGADIYYLIDLADPGIAIPEGLPVRLELSRGNEAGNGLNPAIYRKAQFP